MGEWAQVLWFIGAVIMGYLVYRLVCRNPQAFSKANFSKSAYTMGFLALGLIAFIGILVLLLRN